MLGALCQLKHNKYSLEDPTGIVDLDLSESKFHRGLYTENCYVLVEGWYEDLVFHVVAMGHPPVEMSEASRSVFGTQNYFGGPLEVAPKAASQLLQIEMSDDSAMMVFVSDLWLDKPAVLEKFNQVNIKCNSVLKLKSHFSDDDTKSFLSLYKMQNCLLNCT